MYEERRDSFSLKDVILQILFVVLFVFILIWLFPTKGYLDKRLNEIEKGNGSDISMTDLEPLFSRIFTENILTMKDAAKSYFTDPRLPKNVGDKVTKTLREMQALNIILPFKDSKNNSCDLDKSYVEITKMDDEYVMKVNLSCTDNDAYIIEYMGCYTYCTTSICEKDTTPKAPVSNTKYRYQYSKTTNCTWGNWSNWSDWSTNAVDKTNSRDVETKTEQVLSHYEQKWGVVRTETVTETKTETAAHTSSSSSSTKTVAASSRKVATGTSWSAKSRKEYTSTKSSTSTTKYTLVSTRKELSCTSSCKTINYYIYDVQTLVTNYKTEYYCNSGKLSGKNCIITTSSTTKSCPTGFKEVNGVCTKTSTVTVEKPIYGWIQGEAVYVNVTYYRYRTKACTGGTTDYKWSTSNADKSLLDQGYKLTGKKEAIKETTTETNNNNK